MKPDTREWRTASTYAFMDEIGTDDFAWECLRRNKNYQKDFAAAAKSSTIDKDEAPEIRRRWGLRFSRPPKP